MCGLIMEASRTAGVQCHFDLFGLFVQTKASLNKSRTQLTNPILTVTQYSIKSH